MTAAPHSPDLPAPLVPAEVDLRDFPFTPMFRSRLFGSSFHARVSDAGWRAGVTLWLKSWDQMPAGTLPDDEIDLCRLAELGRETKAWRKVAKEALWGWFKCSDGRLHHKTVAEGVLDAWNRKLSQRDRTEAARAARSAKRQQQSCDIDPRAETTDTVTMSATGSVTENVTASKGQGQGQGQIYSVLTDGSDDPPIEADPPPKPAPTTRSRPEPGGQTASDAEIERVLFARGKATLGPRSGGQISQLVRVNNGSHVQALAIIDLAAKKQNPREYVAACILRGGGRGPPSALPYDPAL